MNVKTAQRDAETALILGWVEAVADLDFAAAEQWLQKLSHLLGPLSESEPAHA